MIRRHYRTVKKAIKKSNLAEPFICSKYQFSPFAACEHGCLYCDGRAEKYYVDGEFDRDIVIRENLPELLERELPKLREKGIISIGSGISDAYQPVEQELGLMRRCAEVLAKHDYPVTILTKSSLIMRDLDLWAKVGKKAGFMLAVSLTFSDDALRSVFEPRASSVGERLEMLQAFKQAGCSTGILAMPFLSYITDTDEHLAIFYENVNALEAKPDFIMPAGLTLRPGRQKETYLAVLRKHFPELVDRTREIYWEDRPSGAAVSSYNKLIAARFSALHRKYGFPLLVPHSYYRNKLQLYDELTVLLHHMAELYAGRNIDVRPLKRAHKAYEQWLTEKKTAYNRHRSWCYADLEDELRSALTSGELPALIKNKKFTRFLESIVVNRKTFDYVHLSLRDENETDFPDTVLNCY